MQCYRKIPNHRCPCWMLATDWEQPVAKAMCGAVQSKAAEQQVAAVGLSSGPSQCCTLGFMRCSVLQLEGMTIHFCWRQRILYAHGVEPVQRARVRSCGCGLQACRTAAPGVTSLACCVAARVCWCRRGTWCRAGRCWHRGSRDCKCWINWERPWYRASSVEGCQLGKRMTDRQSPGVN